jgi:hypothetical protein
MTNFPLPRPYRDELVYSAIARYFAYMQPAARNTAYKSLTGKVRFSLDYVNDASELADKVRLTWGKSAGEIIKQHTLLPFYGSLLRPDAYLHCIAVLSRGKATGKVPIGSPGREKILRFCRSCVSEDLANFGETYWRRSHQMSGVYICVRHGEILANSAATINRSTFELKDATAYIQVGSAVDSLVLGERERGLAREVAERCEQILQGRPCRWSDPRPGRLYRAAIEARARGYAYPRKAVLRILCHELSEFYGEWLFQGLSSGLPRPSPRSLEAMLDGAGHPLIHVLWQTFFDRQGLAQ